MTRAQDRAAVPAALKDVAVVDADTHLSEWYDLWTARAPASVKDRVPQVRLNGDKWQWFIDGQLLNRENASSAVRKDGAKQYGWDFQTMQLADVHEGCYNPQARVRMMDEEGIAAQIVYPNLLGFGGQKAMQVDADIRNISVQIFNDAMAELQADSGNRLYPMAMMPWWDVELSVKEARRCAAMGLRGINMNSDPHEHGLPGLADPHWNPLWQACVDQSLPVNFHIGASDESTSWVGGRGHWPGQSAEQSLAFSSVMLVMGNLRVLTNIMVSDFLDRFPDLKVVSVESGVGWIPFLLDALEYQMFEAGLKPRRSPREVFASQIYACSWFEREGLARAAQALGADNLLFETDFPHPTCLYPSPLGYMGEALDAFSPGDCRKIFGGNAERLYNLDLTVWRETSPARAHA